MADGNDTCLEKHTFLHSGRAANTPLEPRNTELNNNKSQLPLEKTVEKLYSGKTSIQSTYLMRWWEWPCPYSPVWQAPPTHPSGQLQMPGATQTPPFLQPCGQVAAVREQSRERWLPPVICLHTRLYPALSVL